MVTVEPEGQGAGRAGPQPLAAKAAPQLGASVRRLLALASRDPPRPRELRAEAAVAASTPQGLAWAQGKLASSPCTGQSDSGR